MMEKGRAHTVDMFNRISRWYDFLNHFLSAGIDIIWRKEAVKRLFSLSPEGPFLDVATGTGDMLLAMKKENPEARVIGVDPAVKMVEVARKKIKKRRVEDALLVIADGEELPLKDRSVSGVTIAFGIRNIPDRKKALAEMARVLKKGGVLVILEFSKPKGVFGRVYDFYFKRVLPFLGALFSKDSFAYNYLPRSVERFPEPPRFADEILSAGFKKVMIEPFTKGICICYIAFKED